MTSSHIHLYVWWLVCLAHTRRWTCVEGWAHIRQEMYQILIRPSHLTAFCAWDSSPHLPVTPAQLMRPGIVKMRIVYSCNTYSHQTHCYVSSSLINIQPVLFTCTLQWRTAAYVLFWTTLIHAYPALRNDTGIMNYDSLDTKVFDTQPWRGFSVGYSLKSHSNLDVVMPAKPPNCTSALVRCLRTWQH